MIRVAWNADYAHALPEGHRFPMEKYELVPEQLVHEGTLSDSQFFSPTPLGDEEVHRVHDPEYWAKLKAGELSRQEERRTGACEVIASL